MNLLLVQAFLGGGEPLVFPLGLSYIASTVKGCNVKIFDPNVSESPYVKFKDALHTFRPDVMGISLRNIDSTNKRKVIFYYEKFKEMIGVAEANSDAKIIVGGSGFSMFAKEIMSDEERIDYGVYLEGENIFPELIKNLDEPEKVKGIFYRRDGEIIFTGAAEKTDMSSLPLPDRKNVNIMPYLNVPDSIGVETKRGCELGCIYCIYGFLNGKKNRLRQPQSVADEIECLSRDMGVGSFTFVDSIFNYPVEHAENICKELIKRGIKMSWSAWFNEKFLTPDFVRLAKEAGCKKIILSPDGFSDESLKMLGKNFNKRDILCVFDMLKNFNDIEVCYNFFKNPPGQKFGAFLELLYFYFKAKYAIKNRVHFEFNSLRIEPHTKLYKIALDEGLIDKNDNLLYPRYYTKGDTRYIEKIFNLLLRLKGR